MDQALDFDSLYNSRLLPVMDKLRAECSNADAWDITGLLSFVAAVVIGFPGLQMHYHIPYYGIYFATLFSLAVVSLFMYTKQNDIFTRDYKKFVIKEIISNLCPGAIYRPDDCISEHDYKISSLFRRHYD